MDECIAAICSTPSVCLSHYYKTANFLFSNSLSDVIFVYSAFITMIYSQGPWTSFGTTVMVVALEELVVAMWLMNGGNLGLASSLWDPGEVGLSFFFSMVGVSFGMLVIMILDVPRLSIYPKDDINEIMNAYGDAVSINQESRIFSHHHREYTKVQIKYVLEIISYQAMSAVAFFLIPNDGSESGLYNGWFRIDTLVFSAGCLALNLFYFFLNWMSPVEREIMWKNDRSAYIRLHTVCSGVFLLLVLPGMYALVYRKMMILISFVLILSMLGALAIMVTCGSPRTGYGTRVTDSHFGKKTEDRQRFSMTLFSHQ
jgi:hypothetical protein